MTPQIQEAAHRAAAQLARYISNNLLAANRPIEPAPPRQQHCQHRPLQGTHRLSGDAALREILQYDTSDPGRLYWWDRTYNYEELTAGVLGDTTGDE